MKSTSVLLLPVHRMVTITILASKTKKELIQRKQNMIFHNDFFVLLKSNLFILCHKEVVRISNCGENT